MEIGAGRGSIAIHTKDSRRSCAKMGSKFFCPTTENSGLLDSGSQTKIGRPTTREETLRG